MKVSELNEKSVDDLNQALMELLEKQFKTRMQQSTGQLAQTHLLGELRRDIARVKTVLNQRAGS